MKSSYSIRAVSEETGLSAHTIRAWEKRYGVPSPVRTDTNRRVYAEADVERLKLLQRAISGGHSIGMIASLSIEELWKIVRQEPTEQEATERQQDFYEGCKHAIVGLDSERFEATLARASAVLGIDKFLSDVVVPLIEELGVGWEEGRITIAQEHMASALIRTQMEKVRASIQSPARAPRIIVTTPSWQTHELGALLAAITAARVGWNVTYLGPSLPASEIVEAVRQIRASVVALSVVHPQSDPVVSAELESLRSALGLEFPILVGGRATDSYLDTLTKIGAEKVSGLSELQSKLTRLESLMRTA